LTLLVIVISTLIWSALIVPLAIVKFLVPWGHSRRVASRWIMRLGENWVSCNTLIFSITGTTSWDVRGLDGLRREEWYLVMVNHQTWVDIVVMQTVFSRRIPFLKFFIKQQLMWFPVLGFIWWAMDMPFMQRHSKSYLKKHPEEKGKDLDATRAACEKFRETPTSVINFLEGTRFSEAKRLRRKSEYQNLLPARAGGAALAISSMGQMFDAILDVTIVYPRGIANFWEMLCGHFGYVVVHIQKRPVEDWMLAGDYANDRGYRRAFHGWLAQVWAEKDARINTIRAEFPQSPEVS